MLILSSKTRDRDINYIFQENFQLVLQNLEDYLLHFDGDKLHIVILSWLLEIDWVEEIKVVGCNPHKDQTQNQEHYAPR